MVRIDAIFEIFYGVSLEYQNCEELSFIQGGIPFVSRTSKNNGVVGYVDLIEGITPNPANTISVACGGSVLSTFYQSEPYYSGFHILYLKPINNLTEIQMLYYCMIIESNKYKYSYGRQANKTLKQILVPAIEDIPQTFYNFNVEEIKPKIEYYSNDFLDINTNTWRYFDMAELFPKLVKCKCGSAVNLLNNGNDIYYIGAKKNENGVMQKVEIEYDLISDGNCIVFIGDGEGSVGYVTYQPEDFIGSTTLTCGYNEKLNKYNALFLVTLLDRERYRFSYGRKYGKEQIKKMKIKLPADNDGQPDFEFMEKFIKTLKYSNAI